jgi:hypothetical protein
LSALEARSDARVAGSGADEATKLGGAEGESGASMEARDGNGLVSGRSTSTAG